MPTVLVTGGAGYIGAHVCKALRQEGFTPVTYDDLSTGHGYAVKWGPFVHASLADKGALKKVFESHQFDAVLHFAASALVVESTQNPGKYYQNNIANTLNLLETMRDFNVLSLIFSSTCAIYGSPRSVPITEDHPQLPINPYGKSKLMVEQILQDFDQIHHLRSVCLRYFNAAGADLEMEIGENHTPETHLIPSIIQTSLGQQKEIVVYGTDFPTPDGSAVRDYIHVKDLAGAHVAALKWILKEKRSEAFNLGTGKGCSVLEILKAVQDRSSQPLQVRFEKRREGEPSLLVANPTKAHKMLQWEPKHSDPDTIIESAWRWHQLLAEKAPLLAAVKE